jgi:cyanophycin synthetase
MAELKEFIVQRARGAVVLNADNAYSAGMLPRLTGRQAWLVSAERTCADLLAEQGDGVNFCVAERDGDTDWIKLYTAGRIVPVMPVRDIPITHGGQLRYNVSNALQATAAAFHLGAAPEEIREALSAFTPSFEDSPGRLNFYRELPFTVLMDSAHSGEGFEYLMDFVDTLQAEERKAILFAVSGSMKDEDIAERAGMVAGHFDLYLCRNYPNLHGRQPDEVPGLMRKALEERGVPPSSIVEVPEGNAVETALRACRPGDLLVVCCSVLGLRDEWATITSFGRGAAGQPED